ncbi:MAG: hypothetical protein JWO02_3747 [Solirubrobacterales bacterium]|nr:hypothetical protein [Solirubrobacterales bacterium]
MASADISRRELLALALGALTLAVAMFWPLALHTGSQLPKDLGDPLAQAWQLAWGGHALVHQPGSFFQSNQFWPLRDTLAFSDALVGYAPLATLGHGPSAAVARYDVLFLVASALAFAGAYLLARELGVGVAGALVAGAAFAYAPWRLEQGGHLHILSSGAIPLALFLMLRGYRRGSWALIVGGWAAIAWQVSIGFSLGLPLLVVLTGAAVAALPWWWRRGRPRPDGRRLRATAVGLALVAVTAVVLSAPYLRVREDQPQFQRSAQTIAAYSAGPRMFLASSALNPLWGRASAGIRDSLPAVPEQTLFPGALVLLLAAAGVGWSAGWPRRLRLGLLAAAGLFAVLSLGFETGGAGRFLPYRLLYEVIPGWPGIRVPERMNTFTSLALAMLAAGGTARVLRVLGDRSAVVRAAVTGFAVGIVLLEGAGFTPGRWYPHPVAPVAPAAQAGLRGPLLHLPAAPQDNREYLLWSTDGLQPMVNGRSSLQPPFTARLLSQLGGFPDRASVARLRRLGVQTVVLHTDRTAGTRWAAWQRRPTRALGVRRTVGGGVAVYRLR